MNYQNIFKRYELKYLLNEHQYEAIKQACERHTKPDKFGNSIVCSLYFDTENKVLIRRSQDKPMYKEKLRLRSYGIPKNEDTVFVELKKKYDGVVYKRRVEMTYEEAKRYLLGHGNPPYQSQIMKEIDYFLSYYKTIQPSMMILCNREAIVGVDESDLRITFDKNIRFREQELTLQTDLYGTPLMEPNQVLMEIKTASAIPLWLTGVLSKEKIFKTSFSKYGNAYELAKETKKERMKNCG